MTKEKDLTGYPDLAQSDTPEEAHDDWNEELPGAEIEEDESSEKRTSKETSSSSGRNRLKVTVRHPGLLESAVEETGLSRSQIYSLALKDWAERQDFGT